METRQSGEKAKRCQAFPDKRVGAVRLEDMARHVRCVAWQFGCWRVRCGGF